MECIISQSIMQLMSGVGIFTNVYGQTVCALAAIELLNSIYCRAIRRDAVVFVVCDTFFFSNCIIFRQISISEFPKLLQRHMRGTAKNSTVVLLEVAPFLAHGVKYDRVSKSSSEPFLGLIRRSLVNVTEDKRKLTVVYAACVHKVSWSRIHHG